MDTEIKKVLPIDGNLSFEECERILIPEDVCLGILDENREIIVAEELRKQMKTKCSSILQKVGNLSGGNQQKVVLSKWMFSEPDILILDEVFGSGADAEFEEKASKKMAELIKRGSTVILASHNLKTIREHCSKVIFIDNGKIIDIGSSEEIINEYKNL